MEEEEEEVEEGRRRKHRQFFIFSRLVRKFRLKVVTRTAFSHSFVF
jgi:hypothetical protein